MLLFKHLHTARWSFAGLLILAGLVISLSSLNGCRKSEDQTGSPPADVAVDPPDAESGQAVFMTVCSTCHGQRGQGLPHQGASLRTSVFVAGHSDKELIQFIKKGRRAKDPENKSGVDMPPSGNVPGGLDEGRLGDIVAFLRQIQAEEKQNTAQRKPAPASQPAASPVTAAGPGLK